jgi:hypothetical protein
MFYAKYLRVLSFNYIHVYIKQEGHDGPEVAHLYIGPRSRASLKPGAFI